MGDVCGWTGWGWRRGARFRTLHKGRGAGGWHGGGELWGPGTARMPRGTAGEDGSKEETGAVKAGMPVRQILHSLKANRLTNGITYGAASLGAACEGQAPPPPTTPTYLHAASESTAHRDLVFRGAPDHHAPYRQPGKHAPDICLVLCGERGRGSGGCIHHPRNVSQMGRIHWKSKQSLQQTPQSLRTSGPPKRELGPAGQRGWL